MYLYRKCSIHFKHDLATRHDRKWAERLLCCGIMLVDSTSERRAALLQSFSPLSRSASLSSEAQAERQAVRGEAQSAREARPEEEGSRALGRRRRQTPEQRRHRARGAAADQDDDDVQEPTGRCCWFRRFCYWFPFAYVYC